MSGAVVAIVGAESTGKTTLAAALGEALADGGRRRVAVVGEHLRDWCDAAGRTPRADEQRAIARAQHHRIDAAAATHDLVVADTTALLTAVYSRHVFGDRTLDAEAVALHARVALTLLTALDLPWVADGLQRTGEHVREPVDTMLRELLATAGVPWAVVGGSGPARLRQALAAAAPLLRDVDRRLGVDGHAAAAVAGVDTDSPAGATAASTPRAGVFSRLLDTGAAAGEPAWACACCSVPEFERASMRGPAGRR